MCAYDLMLAAKDQQHEAIAYSAVLGSKQDLIRTSHSRIFCALCVSPSLERRFAFSPKWRLIFFG